MPVETKPKTCIPKLCEVWHRASEYAKHEDFENAYRTILREGDDMYLLRLVVQTRDKKATYKLEPATARAVIARLNKIVRVGIFE